MQEEALEGHRLTICYSGHRKTSIIKFKEARKSWHTNLNCRWHL